MNEMNILIETIEKVKRFETIAIEMGSDVDLVSGRYVIDAKSILGILSMDLTKPLKLVVHAPEEETKRVLDAFREFEVD